MKSPHVMEQSLEEEQLTQTETIRLLLASFLPGKDAAAILRVTDEGDNYAIAAESAAATIALERNLAAVFGSYTKLRNSLEYTVEDITQAEPVQNAVEVGNQEYSVAADSDFNAVSMVKIKELHAEDGRRMLNLIFDARTIDEGNKLLKRIFDDKFDISKQLFCIEEEKDDGNKLHIKLGINASVNVRSKSSAVAFVNKGAVEAINSTLYRAAIVEIKAAIEQGEKVTLASVRGKANKNNSCLNSQQILILSKKGDGEQTKLIMQFFYKRLLMVITPPIMMNSALTEQQPISAAIQQTEVLQQVGESCPQVLINKTHLLSYLGAAFNEGFILSAAGLTTEKGKVRPFFFSASNPIPQKKVLVFILDISGSMDGVSTTYRDLVKQCINKYYQKMSGGDVLRVILFNSTASAYEYVCNDAYESHDGKLSNELPDMLQAKLPSRTCGSTAEQQEFLNKIMELMVCTSCTALNKTIFDELYRVNQVESGEVNVNFVVFTDGADNESKGITQEQVVGELCELRNKQRVPRMFTFGLGESYDTEFFKYLAQHSGVSHSHLDNMEKDQGAISFSAKVFEHLNAIEVSRKLYVLVQGLVKQVVSNAEGSVALGFPINPAESFTINGQTFGAKLTAETVRPDASSIDLTKRNMILTQYAQHGNAGVQPDKEKEEGNVRIEFSPLKF